MSPYSSTPDFYTTSLVPLKCVFQVLGLGSGSKVIPLRQVSEAFRPNFTKWKNKHFFQQDFQLLFKF